MDSCIDCEHRTCKASVVVHSRFSLLVVAPRVGVSILHSGPCRARPVGHTQLTAIVLSLLNASLTLDCLVGIGSPCWLVRDEAVMEIRRSWARETPKATQQGSPRCFPQCDYVDAVTGLLTWHLITDLSNHGLTAYP